MRFPLLGKLGALGAVMAALLLGLGAIGGLVAERQQRQHEAEQSVADSLAGPQTVLGPALQRRCHETWQRTEGEGAQRKTLDERRDFTLTAWPRSLNIVAGATIEPRYRGLFKLNSYVARHTISADWHDLAALQPRATQPGGRVACEAPAVTLALSDARGIRSAAIRQGAERLGVLPGSLSGLHASGLHAALPEAAAAPLHLEIDLELAGTRSLAWVPIGGETRVQLASNWAHPSFGGRFLPAEREVGDAGFTSAWQVSALATTAQQAWHAPAVGWCELGETKERCTDSFGVSFIDPVSGYVLSDRALKYGLLFIVLTFVGVGLVEVMRRVQVHPVQYLLVGCALVLFFLLLLSLGEHIAFHWAYLAAALGCSGLLAFYASHILHGLRPGLLFGAAIGLLYAVLYALLQMEQAALVLGSLLLFGVLAAVMVATRRIDWYTLSAQLRERQASTAQRPVPG